MGDDDVRLSAVGDGRYAVVVDGKRRGYLRRVAGGVEWMPTYARFTLRLSWGEFRQLCRPR